MVAPGAAGRIEVLNLEQNDLREAGLLELVRALAGNTTLRELRLTGQKMGVVKSVEEAMATMVDGGGASALQARPHLQGRCCAPSRRCCPLPSRRSHAP